MTIECFDRHKEHLIEWSNGITICILCAAKHELAQSLRTVTTKMKMLEAA